MKKRIYFLFLVFAVGIFLIPKISVGLGKGAKTGTTEKVVDALTKKEVDVFLAYLKRDPKLNVAWGGLRWNEGVPGQFPGYLLRRNSSGNEEYYEVYLADINHDDQQEYVLTQVMQGSGNFSELSAVFSIEGISNMAQLKPLTFRELVKTSLSLKAEPQSCVNWYCSLAKPFLTQDAEQGVVMHFFNGDDVGEKTCRYVWKAEGWILLNKKPNDCIGGAR